MKYHEQAAQQQAETLSEHDPHKAVAEKFANIREHYENALHYAVEATDECENGHWFCADQSGGTCAYLLLEGARTDFAHYYGEEAAKALQLRVTGQ